MKRVTLIQLDTAECKLLKDAAVPLISLAFEDKEAPQGKGIRALAHKTECNEKQVRWALRGLILIRSLVKYQADPKYWEEILPGDQGGSALVLDHAQARTDLAANRAAQLAPLDECIELVSRALVKVTP